MRSDHFSAATTSLMVPFEDRAVLEMRFPGVLLHHHLDRDFADFTKLVSGVNAQRLMSNPVLDRAQQRRSHLVGEERMLFDIHRRPRNGRKPITVVCENARANGDAFVTDLSPRIITGARNELRNRVLRFVAKRAAEAARLCFSLSHLTSPTKRILLSSTDRVADNTHRSSAPIGV